MDMYYIDLDNVDWDDDMPADTSDNNVVSLKELGNYLTKKGKNNPIDKIFVDGKYVYNYKMLPQTYPSDDTSFTLFKKR